MLEYVPWDTDHSSWVLVSLMAYFLHGFILCKSFRVICHRFIVDETEFSGAWKEDISQLSAQGKNELDLPSAIFWPHLRSLRNKAIHIKMTPWACSNRNIHYPQHPCHHESCIGWHASLNCSHSVLRYKPDWSSIMSWRKTILLIYAHVFDVRRTLWMWYQERCMHVPSENFSLEHT